MKKIISAVLAVIIAMSFMTCASASTVKNRVYADKVNVESGEIVSVPIKIENNTGFMGFSIIIKYDAKVFEPVSVSKGKILNGMLNDSISTSKNNTFKVVFTSSENITADGVLFTVALKTASGKSGNYSVEISYLKDDTFNEKWEDVVFRCEKFPVIVTSGGTTKPSEETERTTVPETTTRQEPTTRSEEKTTKPSENPEKPVKKLSERMSDWLNGLPRILRFILGLIVRPLIFIVRLFESLTCE